MKWTSSLFLFVVSVAFAQGTAVMTFKDPIPCGDWISYKEEKCFKIMTRAGHQTQQDAEIICESFSEDMPRESYPRLVTIKSKEEQEFLENLIFVDNHVKDTFWLGLKEVGNRSEFVWNDGSKPYYTNWADITISDTQHHCVQMESGASVIAAGLWIKVDCEKTTAVVCERTQTLTLEALHNMFLNYKLETNKELEIAKKNLSESKKQIDDSKKEITDFKERIDQLTASIVPIGFIYTQIPGQDPPTVLWPGTNWTDISSNYSGLFFRVVGDQSAPFGQVQEGDSKRLEQVEFDIDQLHANLTTVPVDGSWSSYIPTGGDDGTFSVLRFRIANQEVRPRNQAMIVWQRIE